MQILSYHCCLQDVNSYCWQSTSTVHIANSMCTGVWEQVCAQLSPSTIMEGAASLTMVNFLLAVCQDCAFLEEKGCQKHKMLL